MSRAATLLVTIAVVFLTTALTVTYTPALVAAPDMTGLYVLGGSALVAAVLVDSDFARTHIPFLRPAFIETQRQLGIVAHEGQRLLGLLNAYPATENDAEAREYWQATVQRWTDWADRIIHWRLPHLRDAFANQAGRDEADYHETKWKRDLQTWFGVLMLRLNEYTQNADRHQHVVGPEPAYADREIPDWGQPPQRPTSRPKATYPESGLVGPDLPQAVDHLNRLVATLDGEGDLAERLDRERSEDLRQ